MRRPRRSRARVKVRRATITAEAKVIFSACWPAEGWPRGWRVEWVGWMRGARGLTVWAERRILLSWGDARRSNWLETLVHEFVHMRCPKLRHGKEFKAMVARAYARLWEG